MPCCQVICSVEVGKAAMDAFLADVETTVSKVYKKPTRYIMATLTTNVAMRHNGGNQPCANVCLQSIGGLNSQSNSSFCAEVSALCQKHLGVPADRVFFQFVDFNGANFGIGSQVFG